MNFQPIERICHTLPPMGIGMILFLCWLFTITTVCALYLRNRISYKKMKREAEVGELYSPAYALLLSKRSKKIESEQFQKTFHSLIINKWHHANDPDIRTEMKEWLRNHRDPEGYRLQMLLELKLEEYHRKHSKSSN